jgi:CHAT domain-containing protein
MYEEAIKCLDQAIDINPNNDASQNNKGVILLKSGRYEEAIKFYDRAIEINPNNDDAWNNKGAILLKSGRYEEAVKFYDRAIEINPNNDNALTGKGNFLSKLGMYEEAISYYDRVLAITRGNYWEAWMNRGNSALRSDGIGKKPIELSLPKDMQNPALDLRGYQGELESFNEGLKYIKQATEPEGWGELHHCIGNARYFHGKQQPDCFSFWRKAIPNYEMALETLTATPQFETAHLETLHDLIRVLLPLSQIEKAESLLRMGRDFLDARLAAKSGKNRECFEKQFIPIFHDLTVVLYVQQGKLKEAIEFAEKDKNAFLHDGLLADTTESSPNYSQMCAFLKQKPTAAIIYWHLSDNALTTFIMAPNTSSEITLTLPATEKVENGAIAQRNELNHWMAAWQKDYDDYRGKKNKSNLKEAKPESKGENHPWRVQMEERLANLKNILRIADIEIALADFSHCTQLLLIPHRDLHLFPLDSLFDPKYTISYLPSIQVGIKLLDRPKPTYKRLLSIENPDSANLPKLTAAEAESELICRIYGESTRRAKAETTLAEVTAQLTDTTPQPHTIFHFTGHGSYNFLSPIDSALALSGSDRLTLKAIGNLDLSSYQLACLCACETAIAGNQTITKEYIGIVSAFMYSGVANVVSTLWTVESISSAILMIEFHRRYVAGESADVALAAAKHWLRNITKEDLINWYQQKIADPKNYRLQPWLLDHLDTMSESTESHPYHHPYHWSAFTITGL